MNEEQKALLRKGVEWVEEQAALPTEDRNWFQGAWRLGDQEWSSVIKDLTGLRLAPKDCGTSYCLFGYMAEVDNIEWVNPASHAMSHFVVSDQSSYGITVKKAIQKRLGLTEHQADELSSPGNTAEDIRALAEKYAGGPL